MRMGHIRQFVKNLRKTVQTSERHFDEVLLSVFAAKYLLEDGRIAEDALTDMRFCKAPALSRCFALWHGRPLPAEDIWEQDDLSDISQEAAELIHNFLWEKTAMPSIDALMMRYPMHLSAKRRKQQGIFYTPKVVAKRMAEDLGAYNHCMMIDPACGMGQLLLAVYEKWRQESVSHETCLDRLWGMDSDGFAVLTAKCVLALQGRRYYYPPHIKKGDALVDLTGVYGQFDGVICNPPYVGHKQIAPEQMAGLRDRFPQVYADKGNLMHCFFALAQSLLKAGGKAVFLTTRYYVDAKNAGNLRRFLTAHFQIKKIVDYYGWRVVAGVGVDPMITVTKKKMVNRGTVEASITPTRVYRYNMNRGNFDQFSVTLIDDRWALMLPEERELLHTVEKASHLTTLRDVAVSFQGIITGCDAAFVTDEKTAAKLSGVSAYPWIKNSDITCFAVKETKRRLLSFKTMSSENVAFLAPYAKRLKNRRECQNGCIDWWQWQWRRSRADFDAPKIIFPYKAQMNRFALDDESRRFSADVYALRSDSISLKALCVLLNTPLYDAYYKIIAKKLGDRLYEYYPNQVMRLKIPAPDAAIYCQLQKLYDIMTSRLDAAGLREVLLEADALVCRYFNIVDTQRKAIEDAYTKYFF